MTSFRRYNNPHRILSSILIVCVALSAAAQLPKDWIKCHLKDPNANHCMKQAIQDVITKSKNPTPELQLASLEPLLIPALTIGAGSGPVNVVQNFRDIKLHGLTDSKVLSASVDLDSNIILAKSLTPYLRLEADYSMNGRILLIPIRGDGPCNVTLINTAINHTLHGERVTKKGKEYFRVKDYTVTLYPEKVGFKFDNLFNGDERIGSEINRILNENQEAVFADVRDGYEQSFGLIFQDLANRVFNKVGFKDLFIDL